MGLVKEYNIYYSTSNGDVESIYIQALSKDDAINIVGVDPSRVIEVEEI